VPEEVIKAKDEQPRLEDIVPKPEEKEQEDILVEEKDKNNLEIQEKKVIFDSGGSIGQSIGSGGALDSYSIEGRNYANSIYDVARNDTNHEDVKRISQKTGWDENVVMRIKQHVFLDFHDAGQGESVRFEPNYYMAQAWDRLVNGQPTKDDILLLKHEDLERLLMTRYGMQYHEAHVLTNTRYDWEMGIDHTILRKDRR
jgi:hypothetical protein